VISAPRASWSSKPRLVRQPVVELTTSRGRIRLARLMLGGFLVAIATGAWHAPGGQGTLLPHGATEAKLASTPIRASHRQVRPSGARPTMAASWRQKASMSAT